MEFKTTSGGDTSLVFDGSEQMVISQLAKRRHLAEDAVVRMLTTARQANPLADFDELILLAFPDEAAGVVPVKGVGKLRMQQEGQRVDPNFELEQQIRRRLTTVSGATVGNTSQAQQTEATLLQALATCLQTRALLALPRRD